MTTCGLCRTLGGSGGESVPGLSRLLEAPVGWRPLVCFHPHAPVSCVWTVVPKAPPRMTPGAQVWGFRGTAFSLSELLTARQAPRAWRELHLGTWTPGSSTPSPALLQVCPTPPSVPTEPSLSASPGVPAPSSHFSCPHMSPRAAPLHKSSGSLACLSLYFSSLGHGLILGVVDPRSSTSHSRPLFPKRGLETLQGATIVEEMEAGLGSGWAGCGGAGGGCPRWGHLEPA